MSIPPLVCSTPPPLEQCDDDKDAEEFDLQYNLSHYDDDDVHDYNYGSFNSYNNIESSSPEKNVDVEFSKQGSDVKVIENVEIKDNVENSECTIDRDKNEVNTEEEINVEDLDLKLVSEEPPDIKDVPTDSSIENKCDVNSNNFDVNVASIPDSLHEIDANHCIVTNPIVEDIDVSRNDTEKVGTKIQDTISSEIKSDQIDNNTKQDNEDPINFNNENNTEKLDTPNNEQDIDDDFDDFQFINSENNSVNNADKAIAEVFVTQESPWGDEESTHADFGDFTANFEDSASQVQTEEIKVDDNEKDILPNTVPEEDDDDFGDFDDFKSSATTSKNGDTFQESPHQVPVLNLQSTPENEIQVMESINKLLSSIFREETLEAEESVQMRLDAVLNETWGHLMETDVRQPYIVNWNNSLAQKTLLKALCIDSRNILFGPKWSYNMPKYAANLTTAPLQPLKQPSTPNVAQNETSNPDKAAAKSAAWTDPFATNGQEFTYAEALLLDLEHLMATLDQMAHNHTALKISELLSHACSNEGDNTVIEPRPTDLDVFEAVMSTKKDKIYSSTISVQPIRQINLPDTHIFTPTDSETPRSKTIHYDCSPAPTVLLPQPVVESFKIDETKPAVTPSISNIVPSTTDTDNEYWEFQDFKGTTPENTQPPLENKEAANNSIPKSNTTYQTQMLQPIKLEPIIPTLNWPDPGEIKETFEDFSDFVANNNSSGKTIVLEEQNKVFNVDITKSKSIEMDVKGDSLKSNDSFDDEFDTFQSALPPKQSAPFDFNLSGPDNLGPNKVQKPTSSHENIAEFNCVFPKNSKSDDISFTNFNKPLEALPQAVDKTNLKVPAVSGVNVINNSILQPTQTGVGGQIATHSGVTLQNHQKSGQILQPLSLESYSQINWPNPGIDLQDLSRFNPVETLPSLKGDSSGGHSKVGTPVHNQKSVVNNQASDDDIWGEFVSSNPKQPQSMAKNTPALIDDDEWTDFVSSSSVKPPNGLNTISFNVHTNSNMQKTASQSKFVKNNQIPLDIPSLNYITPKTGNHKSYNDKHFQNL